MDLKELLRKRAGLVTEARKITDLATTENRSMTPEERTQFETHAAAAEALGVEIAARQRIVTLESSIANGDGGALLPHHTSRQPYSLLRAVRCFIDHRELDGLEAEVSQEIQLKRGRKVRGNGFVMPLDLPIDLRSAAVGRGLYGTREQRVGVLNTTTGTGGIPTILDTTYIELLRNRMVTRQAGARVLEGMVGNFSIPRQNAASTGYWVAESGAVTGSNQTIDQVQFTPKTCGAMTDISRRLAEQLNTDAENFVREDIAAVGARTLDLAALNGLGSSNQPLGILQNSSITVEAIGSNGGPPSWALVVNLETDVAKANADMGALAYVTNAVVRGKMKTTAKIGSTFPIYLWENGETPLNGYPAYVTNQLPSNLTKGSSGAVCSPLIFGNWNDLIFALWSGQDVIVDPYTGSSSGTVRLVTLQDADVQVRHPESFANCVDLTTT
jgi:HK97 family phage major capsid protein